MERKMAKFNRFDANNKRNNRHKQVSRDDDNLRKIRRKKNAHPKWKMQDSDLSEFELEG